MLAQPSSLPSADCLPVFPQSPLPRASLSPSASGPSSPLSPKKRGRRSTKQSPSPRRRGSGDSPGANQNFGHWSLDENKRYHWFLQIHHVHFLNKHLRRMDKIFKAMAVFVGSREAEQCRSHHQKMEKKYDHSICRILLSLRQQHYQHPQLSELEEELREHQLLPTYPLLSCQFLQSYQQGQAEQEDGQQGEMEGEREGKGEGVEREEREERKEWMWMGGEEVRMIEEVIDWGECGVNLQQLLNDHNNAPHNNYALI